MDVRERRYLAILSLEEMGNNYMETMAAVISMMEEKEKMIMSCKEVMQLDCGMTREKELMQQRACNETERELQLEKKMNEGEALAQENEGGIKFSEEQKREMEELHGKFIQLKKEIVAESSMKLEIERLMALQEDDVLGTKQITDEINKKSSQQRERVQHVLALILTAEVFAQEARKKLIFELSNVNVDVSIGVKRLGEIDKKPFYAAAAQKYSADEAEAKAAEMCSLWQGYIKNLFDDEDEVR